MVFACYSSRNVIYINVSVMLDGGPVTYQIEPKYIIAPMHNV